MHDECLMLLMYLATAGQGIQMTPQVDLMSLVIIIVI